MPELLRALLARVRLLPRVLPLVADQVLLAGRGVVAVVALVNLYEIDY